MRYAAKLLFQYRVEGEPASRKTLCEERIICFERTSPQRALAYAKSYGKKDKIHYKNCYGQMVYFELVGVLDMLQLDLEHNPLEIWYEHKRIKEPYSKLPADEQLIERI